MKKLFIILGVLIAQTLYAQNYVHQVLILNEGVTVAFVVPANVDPV